jgi:lipopolysaccharide biosynthesis protein
MMRLTKPFRRFVDSVLARFVDPKGLILQRWPGKAPALTSTEKKLCLFAHFDAKNKIAPYVVHHLQCLRELGADIVFISTAEQLPEQEIAKILPLCTQIIRRRNITLDFGSWRVGLVEIKNLSAYDQLILANDSVYGPFFPLSEVFKKMASQNLDFWGISSTRERDYHIQSYFLVFNKKTFESESFRKFWQHFHFYRSKRRIISEYEIGLTNWARDSHWHLGAYIEHSQVTLRDVNPTLFYWDRLIEEYSCPFLKTEVLRLNRAQSERIHQWQEIIHAKSSYDTGLIWENLNKLP